MVVLLQGRAHARDFAVSLINPNGAAHLLQRVLATSMGLGVWITSEVESDGVPSVQTNSAWPGKRNNLQQARNGDVIPFRIRVPRFRDLEDLFIDPVLFLTGLLR